jgi:hypothetical protein
VLTWETFPNAIYPFARHHAVSGNHEYRIFYDREAASQGHPWILVVREVGEDGAQRQVHYANYPTDDSLKRAAELWDEAKKAADLWEGPPPRG